MDFKPVFLIIGVFLVILGGAMLLPALADLRVNNPDWVVFFSSSLFTQFVGFGLWNSNRGTRTHMSVRQAFLMTTLSWTVLALFAALPLVMADIGLSFIDAFFEAMSGLTTTGSTVISGLDAAPPGILLWRAMLNWLGGLGIVVMAVAVLPMLQVGGMQLFKAEALDTSDKILPRTRQISGGMSAIYLGLTAICAVCYMVAGMGGFDAIAHAMTTVATGGFGTKDASIGFFQSATIDWIAIFFMILGSLPFLLYLRFLRGDRKALFTDSQVKAFIFVLFAFIALVITYRLLADQGPLETVIRSSFFNVTSILTGTGYATANYDHWGSLTSVVFLIMMFFGGCAGSTSCGIKIFRFQVLIEDLRLHVKQILYPSGIFVKRYNGQTLDDSVSAAVMSFVFLYLVVFALMAFLLTLDGLDPVTAISGAATSISNVGPALGPIIGPDGTFKELPDFSKWVLTFGMLLGRLEIFTVLVLILPRFWRQ